MANAKWVKIYGIDNIRAVRKAKLPFDGLDIGAGLWVPSWVAKAIKVYQQNEGYAGMDLAEFLTFFRETNNDVS